MKLDFAVPDKGCNRKAENRINYCQNQFQTYNIRQMLWKQKIVLRDVSVIVIGDAYIEQNVENHGKVEQREIQTIAFIAYQVLHCTVDSKNPEWFYQEVEENQQYQVCNKFSFQNILIQLDNCFCKKKKLCL